MGVFVRGHRTTIGLIRGGARIVSRPRQLRYPIEWVAWVKEDERLIYAVVGTRGGGGGGGVKCEERASGVALACGFVGVCLACGFRACRFCLSAYYDRGRVRCCQGGIFGNMSSDAGGGRDSRLRGNDVEGWE